MKFKASYDKVVAIVTSCIFLLFGFIIYKVLSQQTHSNTEIMVKSLVLLFLVLFPVITYLFNPKYYLVDNDEIKIVRALNNIIIKKADIAEVSIPDEKLMKRTIRTFGVGGLFGYFGHFYNKTYGNMRWYATQTKNYVSIKVNNNKNGQTGGKTRKIVLTPDDLMGFVNELKK